MCARPYFAFDFAFVLYVFSLVINLYGFAHISDSIVYSAGGACQVQLSVDSDARELLDGGNAGCRQWDQKPINML